MRLFLKSLFALAAVPLLSASTALADSIVFTNVPNNIALVTYTQGTFTVAPSTGSKWNENKAQGNPPPGLTAGTDQGGPATANSIVVTDSAGAFVFTGFDLDAYTSNALFTVTGSLNGVQVFTTKNTSLYGTDKTITNAAGGIWVTYDPTGTDQVTGDIGGHIDTLTITVTDAVAGTQYGVDNIVVTTTPEPSSLMLLGSGLLGLGAVARRKIFA